MNHPQVIISAFLLQKEIHTGQVKEKREEEGGSTWYQE